MISPRSRPALLVLGLAASLVPLPAGPARGNAAPPWRSGDVVGEPAPELDGVIVEREHLAFDLHPLAVRPGDGRRPTVPVEAIYYVRNDGPERTVELVFLAVARRGPVHGVWLDGRRVPSRLIDPGAGPAAWRPPEHTPAIGVGQPLVYEVGPIEGRSEDVQGRYDEKEYVIEAHGGIAFAPTLSPGRHALRVRYEAEPSFHVMGGNDPVCWQLGYALAPARRWAGFGGLDVEVRLSPDWLFASDPPLVRRGGVLIGSWDELPADALALTVQAPTPIVAVQAPRGAYFTGGSAIWAGAFGLAACWWVGRWAGRRVARGGRSPSRTWPVALAAGVAWPLGVLAILEVETKVVAALRDPVTWPDGFATAGAFELGLLVVPLGFLLALGLTRWAAVWGYRRARAEAVGDRLACGTSTDLSAG